VNVFRKDTGIGALPRDPHRSATLDKLALPPIVTKLCDYTREWSW